VPKVRQNPPPEIGGATNVPWLEELAYFLPIFLQTGANRSKETQILFGSDWMQLIEIKDIRNARRGARMSRGDPVR
jgi:hypothetical protein